MAIVKVTRVGRAAYKAVINVVDPVTGRRRQISRTAATRREAQRLERELYDHRDTGVLVPARDSFLSFLEQWLDRQRPNLRPATVRYYEQMIKHCAPLYPMSLAGLTARDLERLYASFIAEHRGAGVGARVHAFIRAVLKDAVARNHVAVNIADRIPAPRAPRFEAVKLNADNIESIYAVTDQTEIGLLIRLAVATGMRLGELRALTVDDIDFENRRLFVRRTMDRQGRVGPPKTKRSARTITLSPATLTLLDAYRDHTGYLFDLSETYIERKWREIRVTAGIADARFHDLRHYAAASWLSAGAPLPAVSARLGHSNPSITLNVYSYAMPPDDAAIAALDGRTPPR